MKCIRYVLLLSLVGYGVQLSAEPQAAIALPKTKDGNLYLTINVQSNATNKTHQTQLTSMTIPITAQAFAKAVSEKSRDAGNYISRNKKKSLFFLMTGIYGSLVSIMTYARVKIKTHKWANWHSRSSLKELLAYPQEQLATELLYDVQHVYQNKSNPTDIIYPLSQFFIVTTKENAALDFYGSIIDVIAMCRLQRFFPFYYAVANEVRQQQERLNHYINLIKSWTDREKMSKLNLVYRSKRSSTGDKSMQQNTIGELQTFFRAVRVRRAYVGMHETCAQVIDKATLLHVLPLVKRYSRWAHAKAEDLERVNALLSHDFIEYPEGIHLRYDDDIACKQCVCTSSREHQVIERRLRENQHREHHFKSVI